MILERIILMFLFLFDIHAEPVLLLTQHVGLHSRTVFHRLIVVQAARGYPEGRTEWEV